MSVLEQKELRGQAPADLVRALDAIALAKSMDRNQYVNEVLMAHVRQYLSEVSVVQAMLRDNTLMPEGRGSHAESTRREGS